MSLNETNYTSFQIKPSKDRFCSKRCMFRNDAFDIQDIFFISAVGTLGGMNYFQFSVELHLHNEPNKTLRYEFPTKAEALRAQRELCRAYTATEEFKFEELTTEQED